MAAQTDRGIPLSAINPKYLHTNSTSHTWPFSAIAELIDNAYDPDVSAQQFWIDKTRIKKTDCLTFTDNGHGLSYDKMHRMLSFGFSDKQAKKGHVPVGLYGNGFKSGSMRLGKDAIVLSKTQDAMCVGMLSQTYLEQTGASHVVVPIVAFSCVEPNMPPLQPAPENSASLQDILTYSLFQTESELNAELSAITAHGTTSGTGTRIIIWNLRKTETGEMDFDFDTDACDIKIPPTDSDEQLMESSPDSSHSLRAYCSILYLKPRMQIIVRGKKVQTQFVSKNLAHIRKDRYKPNFTKTCVKITFGYNTKSKDHYGIMMYHKNRLIKAYERVGCQLKGNFRGVGVIGVIECNFLKPTHNKQDFDYTDEYRKTISNVAQKLEEYWKEIQHKRRQQHPNRPDPLDDTLNSPDQNWVQCDKCLKWRKLPDGIDSKKLPDKWLCMMNPDPQYRSCEEPEEKEHSDDEATYTKTYKQHERDRKIQLEKERQQMEERRKKEEIERAERFACLEKEKEKLQRKHERLKRLLRRSDVSAASLSPAALSETGQSSECKPSTPSSNHGKKRKGSSGFGAEAKQARSHSAGSEATIASLRAAASQRLTSVLKMEQFRNTNTATPEVPASALMAATFAVTPSLGPSNPEWGQASTTIQTQTVVEMGVDEAAASTSSLMVKPDGEAEVADIRGTKPPTDGDGQWVAVEPPRELTPGKNVLIEAQQQQDQLMELLDKTSLERDAYQTEVNQLTAKVKNLKQNILELTQKLVKKEQNHQACQTNYPECEEDSKSLPQLVEAKRQWEEKSKGEGSSSRLPQKELKGEVGLCSSQVNMDDQPALLVEDLLRELDRCNMERDELKTMLANLEVEKTAFASRIEHLQEELEELKRAGSRSPAEKGQSAAVRAGHEEAGVGTAFGFFPSCQTLANDSKMERQNGVAKVEVETQGEGNHRSGQHGKERKHREDHHSVAPQRNCESCAEIQDSSHWVLVKPEVCDSTYSLSSPAGSYECSKSGLRWSCAAPVTLQYRFIDWHLLADELSNMLYRPAGPSMDIKFISGELEEIHLPHFLCLGGRQSYLKDAVKILHKDDTGLFLEKCEPGRFHARLDNLTFSLFGVFYSLKSLMFHGKEEKRETPIEIHADVQVYLSSTSPLTFRIYLLPLDARLRKLVEDQEEGFKGKRLDKPQPGRPLQMHWCYTLKANCKTIGGPTPKKLDLKSSEIAPTFSDVRISEAADFQIDLLSPVDKQKVWQAHIWRHECSWNTNTPQQGSDGIIL